MVKVCIIKSCPSGRSKKSSKTKLVSFFQPSTKSKLQRWAQSLGIKLKPSDYVCQHHFKEEHMKLYDEIKIGNTVHLHHSIRRTLKEDALPTVEYQSQYYVDPKELKKQLRRDQQLSHKAHQLHLKHKSQPKDQQQHENKHLQQKLDNSSSEEEEMQLTPCLPSLEDIKKNIEEYSMLPAYWFYAENLNAVEFMRIDPVSNQIIKHISLNEDLSITVICSNNEKVTLNDKIMSFKDINKYLKSAERWRLCVGTQVERRKYSKKCRGLIVGDEAYKRFQLHPRCKACRSLRNQLLKRRNVIKQCEHTEEMESLELYENKENGLSSSFEDLINDDEKDIAIIVQEDSENDEINTSVIENLLVEKEEINQSIQQVKILKTKRKIYKCGLCMKKFYSIELYKAHNQTHQTKIVYLNKCGTCNKSFMTRIGFRQHLLKCQKNGNLRHIQYNKCVKIAKTSDSLRQQMKHQFMCHVCGVGCISRRSLKEHLESHKEQKKRNQYICEQCGKIFYTNKKLRSHQRVHFDRNFICNICECTFKAKYNLEQHLLTHEKIHKCEECPKTFATRATYIEHCRVHSGERPFECSYCAKCFRSKRMLSVHILIHTGEKRHKCHICDQRFSQRGSLNRHMKVHAKAINKSKEEIIIEEDQTNGSRLK